MHCADPAYSEMVGDGDLASLPRDSCIITTSDPLGHYRHTLRTFPPSRNLGNY